MELSKKNWIRKHYAILLITLFALVIRLYFFRNTQAESVQDSYRLAKLAKGILHGKYEIMGEFWGAVQPLYPFSMAVLNSITGDLLLSGKIISLLAGVATIPIVYLLWEKLESREVALLTAWLVAVNVTAWHLSIHVFRDALFLFLCMLSFLLLFKAREDFRWLPVLAFVFGLATLTRGEGYILMISCGLAFTYWKRRYLSKKIEMSKQHKRVILISLIAYIIVTYPWHFYKSIVTQELIPYHVTHEVGLYEHLGIAWVLVMSQLVTLPFFILFLGGIFLTYKSREKYLPFHLFVILLSLSHMWYHAGSTRYALPLLPVMLGWASIPIFYFISKFFKIKYAVLSGIIVLSFAYSAIGISELESRGDSCAVIKEATAWFDSNSEKDAVILAGDDNIYGYYTDRRVMSYFVVNGFVNGLFEDNIITEHNIRYPFLTVLLSENISYFVAYDTITPWLYEYAENEFLAENFTTHRYTFEYRKIVPSRKLGTTGEAPTKVEMRIYHPVETEVTLLPLKKFEKNNRSVYLYKIEWAHVEQFE